MQATLTDVNGISAFIQVTPGPAIAGGGGGVDALDAGDKVAHRLEEASNLIVAACGDIMDRLHAAATAARPDELEIAFSLALSAEGGWGFIAKASGEATLEVTAKWDLSNAAQTNGAKATDAKATS